MKACQKDSRINPEELLMSKMKQLEQQNKLDYIVSIGCIGYNAGIKKKESMNPH